MAYKSYYTSTDLINAIKRKIAFPVSQQTFSDQQLLDFCNEEMMIEQVPAILQYHAEYFVNTIDVSLQDNKSNYPIPDRAIGHKLRDIFYKDSANNLWEMTQINSEDRSFFQPSNGSGSTNSIKKFYIQGNDVILTPSVTSGATGALTMVYYLRPNVLVTNDRAATITAFTRGITIVNASISAGNTVTINDIVFTAVSGAPSTNQFQIGATSTATATNLVNAITTNGVITAANGSPATAVVTLSHSDPVFTVSTSNSSGFVIEANMSVAVDAVPSNITSGLKVDFLQTLAGHQTLAMNILIPSGGTSNTSITFSEGDIPSTAVVGDYICLAGESIIPQIPTDLHTSLADRAAMRILEAIGDRDSAALMQNRLNQNEKTTATLVDTRVDGSVLKAVNRHSILSFSKLGPRRRY